MYWLLFGFFDECTVTAAIQDNFQLINIGTYAKLVPKVILIERIYIR